MKRLFFLVPALGNRLAFAHWAARSHLFPGHRVCPGPPGSHLDGPRQLKYSVWILCIGILISNYRSRTKNTPSLVLLIILCLFSGFWICIFPFNTLFYIDTYKEPWHSLTSHNTVIKIRTLNIDTILLSDLQSLVKCCQLYQQRVLHTYLFLCFRTQLRITNCHFCHYPFPSLWLRIAPQPLFDFDIAKLIGQSFCRMFLIWLMPDVSTSRFTRILEVTTWNWCCVLLSTSSYQKAQYASLFHYWSLV